MVEQVQVDPTDPGDKITVSLTFKRALPNYQNITIHSGVSVTRRDDESNDEVWKRAWKLVGKELDTANDRATKIIEGNDPDDEQK